jgi:acyl-CoA thioesterase-1
MEAPPNMGQMYTDAFRFVFASVAEEADALLIPFLLDGVAGAPELNQSDGIHPTPEGHAIMADNAWPVLGPLFAELQRESP